MNSLRKIMTFVVVIAMMAVLSVAVSAATLTIGTVEAEAGDSVVVPVTYTDNPGTNGMQLIFSWAEGPTLTAITRGQSGLSSLDFNSSLVTNLAMWETEQYVNDTTNGEVATLTFKAPETAGEYEVSATLDDCWDMDWEDIDVTIVPGKIVVKEAAPAATLTATGQNLIIDGGVNAKVYFDYTGTGEVTINGKDALKDDNGYYAVIAVSPKDYATKLTFTATDGTLTASHNVSVQDIIGLYIDNADYAAEQALVTALDTYCSYAATYFADGTVPTVDATVVAATPSITGTQTGVTFNSTSLVLRDKVALRHYFNVAAADAATYGLTVLDDTHAYVEYANIAAADLANVIKTEIGGITINFAPLAYANLGIDANTANLVKALYNLHKEAVAYAAN